jgi:L-malate glycosyltransferase
VLSIGFVMTSFEPGGTERQMIELLRRLDRSRWAVHVACFRGEGAWFHRAAEAAQSVAEFPVRSFKSIAAPREMWAFARWCRRQRLDVIHTAELPANIFGLLPAAVARVKVRIANRREINPDKSAVEIALQRAAYGMAHKVVANSQAAAERLRQEGVPARRIAVIANGLEAGRFAAGNGRSRRRRIVVVANLRREKGHDVLIDAAPEIVRRHPDAEFEFVGGGTERDALIERARARGVLRCITFSGQCDEVAQRLAAADVFVLPSRSEAFPNAVLEAMAAGLPVVASGVGGIRELLAHEQTGLLVPPDHPEALTHQICRVLEDEALARRLALAARADARARYSFDRMVEQFETLYLTELARRRGAASESWYRADRVPCSLTRQGTSQPSGEARRFMPSAGARRLQPSDGARRLQPSDGARRLQPSEKVS